MYNMDPERAPSRPVIMSSASANKEFGTWVRENNLSQLLDGAGLVWNVEIEVLQTPDPDDLHKSTWALTVHATSSPDAEDFMRTGTLDATTESDQRLADLLEDRRVSMRLRSMKADATTQEGLRVFLSDALPKLRTHLATQTFHDLKRQRIAAVVRDGSIFSDKS